MSSGSDLTHFLIVSISEIWVSFNRILKRNNVDGSLRRSTQVLFNFIAFEKIFFMKNVEKSDKTLVEKQQKCQKRHYITF